jgi:hypothetical protein
MHRNLYSRYSGPGHYFLLKLKLSQYMPRRLLGKRRYSSYSFSALEGGEWPASRLGRALAPGKGPLGTHCTRGWVGPRAGLDTEGRGRILSPLPGIEPRSPGRPARRQTLYRLSYRLALVLTSPSKSVITTRN